MKILVTPISTKNTFMYIIHMKTWTWDYRQEDESSVLTQLYTCTESQERAGDTFVITTPIYALQRGH